MEEKRKVSKLFFSYGHDANAPLVEALQRDFEKCGYEVWIDKSKLKSGTDWRASITEGILSSSLLFAFASRHSLREPGVCRNELSIAINIRGADILTIKLEPEIRTGSAISKRQIFDFSDWRRIQQEEPERYQAWYQEKLQEILDYVASDEIQKYSDAILHIKEMLHPPVRDAKQERMASLPFTSRFELDRRVDDFIHSDKKMLLILGGPGTGKSSYIAHQYPHFAGSGNARVFCDRDLKAFNNPETCIRQICYQLALTETDYRLALMRILEEDQKYHHLDYSDPRQLFSDLISKPLKDSIDGERETKLIIIDALDEADNLQTGTNPITDTIGASLAYTPSWVKFILTSRPSEHLRLRFPDAEVIDLDHADWKDQDLRAFISGKLCSTSFAPYEQQICQRSQGNYLLAELMINALKDKTISVSEIGSLTGGLASMYFQMFSARFPQEAYQEAYAGALSILCLGKRPVPKWVVQRALDANPGTANLHLNALRPFLYEEKGDLGLFHQSLSDWLTSDAAYIYRISEEEGWKMLSAILEDSVSRMLRKRTWPAGTDDNFIHCMLVPALLHTDPDSKESVLTDAAYGSWLLEKAVQEKENHHLQDAYDLGMNVLEIGSRAEDWQLVIHAAALLAELSYSLILFNDMEKLALAGCKAAMELNDAASATAAAQLCLKIGYNLFRQGRREESWKLYDFGTGLARKAGNENLALELQRQKCEGLLFAEKNGEALELMRSMPLLKAPGKGDKKQASRFQQYCSTYARVLTKNGCLKEAASYFKAGIDSFSPLSPARDLGRKGMLEYGLSNSLFLQNDLEGSFLMAAAALKDLERCYGKNSVELCDDLNQLGILCQKRGEYQMAEHMYRRSFDIRMQFYGAENLLTAISYRNLIAAVTLQSGRFCEEQHESLDAMYREAIRIHKKVTAEGNRIRTVFILNDYAGYLLERQQYAKAAAAAQEAFELADELENPRFVLFTCEKLAKASFMSGDEETGKNAALLGIETAKEHAMQTHPAAVRLQVLLQENA